MLVLKHSVFIDIPKCGCTSIFKALDRYPKPHWHQRNPPDNGLPRFAVVRNPFARALSLFHFERYQCSIGNKQLHPTGAEGFYKEKHLHDFSAFLRELIRNRTNQDEGFPRHYPNFLPCGLFLDDCAPIERVLHLESLQHEWDATPYLPAVTIPHERKQSYDRELTSDQEALIREWAAEDFDRFGY